MTAAKLNQLTKHIHWLPPDATTDRPTLGVIAGTEGTLIVDAGNSVAHANLLFGEMTRAGLGQPKYLVLTHSHWDHVFGTAAFEVPCLAHRETKQVVEEMAGLDWSDEALDQRVADGTEIEFCRDMIKAELPDRTNLQLKPPNIAFDWEIEVDLGEITAQIVHVGGDHASDSVIVYIPEDKVVFLGDCLYEDLHHGPRNYTTAKLFPLIDRLLSYDAEFYVASHHPAPLPRADLIESTGLLRHIGQMVELYGENRALIEQDLMAANSQPLDEDGREIVEAFLAGLQKLTRNG